MSLETLREYHVEAARKLRGYADDPVLRGSDVKHYNKAAEVHEAFVADLDELAAQESLVQFRDLDPAQRLALARGEKI